VKNGKITGSPRKNFQKNFKKSGAYLYDMKIVISESQLNNIILKEGYREKFLITNQQG
jgi:hypothetical protein